MEQANDDVIVAIKTLRQIRGAMKMLVDLESLSNDGRTPKHATSIVWESYRESLDRCIEFLTHQDPQSKAEEQEWLACLGDVDQRDGHIAGPTQTDIEGVEPDQRTKQAP